MAIIALSHIIRSRNFIIIIIIIVWNYNLLQKYFTVKFKFTTFLFS